MAANPDTQSTVEAVKAALDQAVKNCEPKAGEIVLHGRDWLGLQDAIAALAAQPRDDVMQMAMRDSQYYEGAKAYAGMYEQNPQMAKDWLQSGCSGRDKSLSEALSTDSGPTEEQAASDGVEGIARRIEYILDTSASMRNRIHRRSHLTDHDLRTILTRLRTPDERDRALESWLAHEAKHGAEECRKAEAGDDEPFWRRYWAGYAKAFETMAEKARALKGPTQ